MVIHNMILITSLLISFSGYGNRFVYVPSDVCHYMLSIEQPDTNTIDCVIQNNIAVLYDKVQIIANRVVKTHTDRPTTVPKGTSITLVIRPPPMYLKTT